MKSFSDEKAFVSDRKGRFSLDLITPTQQMLCVADKDH